MTQHQWILVNVNERFFVSASFYASRPAVRAMDGDLGIALVGGSEEKVDLPTYIDRFNRVWVAGERESAFGIEVVVPDDGRRYGVLITIDAINAATGNRQDDYFDPGRFWVTSSPRQRGANIIRASSGLSGDGRTFRFVSSSETCARMWGPAFKGGAIIFARFVAEKSERPDESSPFVPNSDEELARVFVSYAPREALEGNGFTPIAD